MNKCKLLLLFALCLLTVICGTNFQKTYASLTCDPENTWSQEECESHTGCNVEFGTYDCSDYNGDEGSCTTTEGCSWSDPDCSGTYQGTDYQGCTGTYEIYGCTDPEASNYDPEATSDDSSCTYIVEGCTDSRASNYNTEANVDDGSCQFLTIDGGLGNISFGIAIIITLLSIALSGMIYGKITKKKPWLR